LIKYTVDGAECVSKVESKVEASKKLAPTEKQTLVHFLLSELVPNRGTDSASIAHHAELSRRATSLVLALLSRTNDVRKRVMTEIVAVLNAPPKARVTMHLQMLQSLAGVLFTFLTAKVTPANPNEVAPETVRQFFDAKVPGALCSAIASIDLHHPNASKVGSALLRPLDILCANSSLTDPKAGLKEALAAGSRSAATATAATPGTHGGDSGGDAVEGAGAAGDELDGADVSLVAPRSGLDDSGTPVRDSMLMALSMQEDEEDARGHQDAEMHDQGSVHDDMRGSDEGEGSDDDGEDEDDDGEDSGAEIESEGSQQDDDHDSQLQDEGWEQVVEDGDQDEHHSLLAAGIERDLAAAAGFMAPELGDVDRERDLMQGLQHHHQSHLLSRQDLDHMFEQLMESDGMNMQDAQMNLMDRIDMIAGDEMRENPQPHHHVLSFQAMNTPGNARILQNLLPFSGLGQHMHLAEHMQVIRLPSGRGGRNTSAGPEPRHSANALHEVPAAEHPLLVRGGEDARGRSVAGALAQTSLDRISRHQMDLASQMEAAMIFQGPATGQAWPGGRFFVGGEEPGMPQLLDPRFGVAGAGSTASRWSDDGGPSSSSMRTVAQQMEDRLVSMLQAAAAPSDAEAAAPASAAPYKSAADREWMMSLSESERQVIIAERAAVSASPMGSASAALPDASARRQTRVRERLSIPESLVHDAAAAAPGDAGAASSASATSASATTVSAATASEAAASAMDVDAASVATSEAAGVYPSLPLPLSVDMCIYFCIHVCLRNRLKIIRIKKASTPVCVLCMQQAGYSQMIDWSDILDSGIEGIHFYSLTHTPHQVPTHLPHQAPLKLESDISMLQKIQLLTKRL